MTAQQRAIAITEAELMEEALSIASDAVWLTTDVLRKTRGNAAAESYYAENRHVIKRDIDHRGNLIALYDEALGLTQ